jgi:excisionase family DNA binding protein
VSRRAFAIAWAEQPAIARAEQRLVYSILEAAYALNLSRATLYRLLAEGKIASIKIGSRRLILRSSIDDLLRGGTA